MMDNAWHILLVDDEEIVRQTLGDYLSECGYRVDQASDGKEALAAIEKNVYDLALVDVRMPGLDGLAFLRQVEEWQAGVPVIVITGHGNVEMESEVQRCGAAGFMLKPVKLFELDAMLEKILSNGKG